MKTFIGLRNVMLFVLVIILAINVACCYTQDQPEPNAPAAHRPVGLIPLTGPFN